MKVVSYKWIFENVTFNLLLHSVYLDMDEKQTYQYLNQLLLIFLLTS